MNLRRLLTGQTLLIVFALLGNVLSTADAWGSSGRRLNIFLAGGGSYPVGQFDHEVRAGYNWGGGVELRFPSNWAIGIVVHRAEFEHQRVYYNSWLRSWRSIDWTFIRGNWYGKYFFRKTGISPFFKTGLGVYSMESKRTFVGKTQAKNHATGFSVMPRAGLEYSTKRVLFFLETNHNVVLGKSIGGDTASNCVAQFLDFSFGAGFSLGRER